MCEFLKFCQEPYAIMMGYSFRLQFSWSWQESEFSWGFIHFIDAEFEFESFSDVLLLCARDVVAGLDYLHSHNCIANRDLELGNTLVSNQHCDIITMDGNWAKVYAECPIVCKLWADLQTCRQPQFCRRGLNQLAVVLLYSWHPRSIQKTSVSLARKT